MFRFWSRIRKRLIKEDKTRSYLLYTSGEILLVMVGILLALQVNNWNEDRKTNKLLNRVLQTLKDETLTNLKEVEEARTYRHKLVDDLRNYRHLVEAAPISAMEFDPADDQAMIQQVRNNYLRSLNKIPDEIKIIRREKERFLISGNVISRLEIENDTFKIYGKDNIRLQTASIRNDAWKLAEATNASVNMDYDLIILLGNINTLFEGYNTSAQKALDMLYTGQGHVLSALEDMVYFEGELIKLYQQVLELIE